MANTPKARRTQALKNSQYHHDVKRGGDNSPQSLRRPNLVINSASASIVAVLPASGLSLRWEIGPDDSVIGFAVIQQMESRERATFAITPVTPHGIIDPSETNAFELICY